METKQRLTAHQSGVLRRVGRLSSHGTRIVHGSDVGSAGALSHLTRKGYLDQTTVRGERGGYAYDYALTDAGRDYIEQWSAVPAAVRAYWSDDAKPTVEQVFADGVWKRGRETGWYGQHLTNELAREMKRAKVETVAVRWDGRVADFQIKELAR